MTTVNSVLYGAIQKIIIKLTTTEIMLYGFEKWFQCQANQNPRNISMSAFIKNSKKALLKIYINQPYQYQSNPTTCYRQKLLSYYPSERRVLRFRLIETYPIAAGYSQETLNAILQYLKSQHDTLRLDDSVSRTVFHQACGLGIEILRETKRKIYMHDYS